MSTTPAIDECYRCGYDLRGIADEQPCPECGLLAQRSRRHTDEFHHTQPRWLRRLSVGIWCMLFGVIMAPGGFFLAATTALQLDDWLVRIGVSPDTAYFLYRLYPMFGFLIATAAIMLGAWLVTSPEGIPDADRADRRRRWAVQIIAPLPLITLLGGYVLLRIVEFSFLSPGSRPAQWQVRLFHWVEWVSMYLPFPCLFISSALPILLFLQLRSLAKRARSPHLAEHCAIVGIGASCSVLFISIFYVIAGFSEEIGLDPNWTSRATTWLVVMLIASTASILFILWSLYLLIRFAIAFGRASRKLRMMWARDDRAALGP